MKIIGITGGIGSGKSEVLKYLKKEYQAFICQADEVAKDLQKKGGACYNNIVAHFGTDILDSDGELDRAKLAALVFGDSEKLKELNAMVHPAVKEQIQSSISEEEQKGTKVYVLEAALLLDDHYESICDEIWYVYANDEVREKRLKYTRGYTKEKIERIFAAQMKRDEYLERCDRAVDNSGSFEETCLQLDDIMAACGYEMMKK